MFKRFKNPIIRSLDIYSFEHFNNLESFKIMKIIKYFEYIVKLARLRCSY